MRRDHTMRVLLVSSVRDCVICVGFVSRKSSTTVVDTNTSLATRLGKNGSIIVHLVITHTHAAQCSAHESETSGGNPTCV